MTDMPLEQLLVYEGKTPCPDDFDRYWKEALEQLDATSPEAVLQPANYRILHGECFDLWFTGIGGARIHARYVRPEGKSGCPAVLHFHGYRWHGADFSQLLPFVSQGMCAASMSCRGQGGPSQDNTAVNGPTYNGHIFRGVLDAPEKLLYRQIFLDTVQLARVVMSLPEVDSGRVGVTGGSQGGGLALACAALEPRIKRAAVQYPFLCDYRRGWEVDTPDSAFSEIKGFFRNVDPRHQREQEFFTRMGYIAVENLAPRIQASVCMATGLCDTAVPPSTQFAAFNRIQSEKRLEVYPDFGHEELPGYSDIILEEMLRL